MRPWPFAGIVAVTLVWSSLALASPDELLGDNTERTFDNLAFGASVDDGSPRLAFVADGTTRVDQPFLQLPGAYGPQPTPKNQVVAWAADKSAAWAVADIRVTDPCIADGHTNCAKLAELAWDHAVVVVDYRKAPRIVAWSVENTVSDAAQAKAVKAGILPAKLERKIDAGAEDAVKQLEATLGDPKAFAASVSDRKDAVLFGSDKAERYTGGAAIKAELAKWGLKLAVRDGVQAGPAGTSLVWIGANVDATPVKQPKAAPVPYRLFAVYEKTSSGWQLVAASFGAIVKLPAFAR